ncbi:MAG: hypothetical protein ACYDH3_00260 [Candidatus Aminicenantales bacterium]
MSTSTYPSKRFYAAGSKKGAAWGTAVDLGAGYGILIENDGNPQFKQPYQPYDDLDAIMAKGGDLGLIGAVDFAPDFAERYDPGPLGSWLAALFGTCPAPDGMYVVSAANNKIDVIEGAGSELTATVASGTYTGTALAVAIAAALNAIIGKTLTYTCTYSSATNKFSIGVSGAATLMWNTGSHKDTDISVLCGYADAADDTGAGPFVSDTVGLGTAMKHVLDFADYNDVFFTYAVERPGKIWEIPSAMPMKYVLKFSAGNVKGALTMRGNTLIDDSAVNTATQLDALTYQDMGNRIKAGHAVVRMNAASGDALAVGDALEVSDMEITIERQLDDYHPAGQFTIGQPKEKGWKVSVKLTLPRTSATNLAYLATYKAQTAQKLDIVFTSPVAAATGVYYSRTFGFPRMKIVEAPAAPLADIMTTTINLEAEEAAAAPTGMTGHVRPYAEMVNLQATGYLA